VLQRVGGADVAAGRADHRRQLHLVVELAGDRVVDDVVAGADDGRAGLGEVHRVLGHGGAALGGVVGVVAAEAEDVARRVRDRRQQAHALERVGQFALRQLLDGLLVYQALAVVPGLVRQD
jgi:hypothetical protein